MSRDDCEKLREAALNWAWFHGKRVKTAVHRSENNLWTIEVQLISQKRTREY